jgi:hypothetical protein
VMHCTPLGCLQFYVEVLKKLRRERGGAVAVSIKMATQDGF